MIEPKFQLGFGERAGHWLARLDLGDLLGEILGTSGVGRGHPHPGEASAGRFAIEHRQQRGLAHVAMTEQGDPLRAGQASFQQIEPARAAFVLLMALLMGGALAPDRLWSNDFRIDAYLSVTTKHQPTEQKCDRPEENGEWPEHPSDRQAEDNQPGRPGNDSGHAHTEPTEDGKLSP